MKTGMIKNILNTAVVITVLVLTAVPLLAMASATPMEVLARAKTGPSQGRVEQCDLQMGIRSALTAREQIVTEKEGFSSADKHAAQPFDFTHILTLSRIFAMP